MKENEAQDDYQAAFEYVRRTFFPRWDRKKEWSIRETDSFSDEGPEYPECGIRTDGYCDSQKKQIKLRPCFSGVNLLRIIIHEICHHDNFGHEGRWHSRMTRAAVRARALGRPALAEVIRQDIEIYVDYFYKQIWDAVMQRPDLGFDDIIALIADDHGFCPENCLKAYRRSRKKYEEAKADYAMEQKARELFQRET